MRWMRGEGAVLVDGAESRLDRGGEIGTALDADAEGLGHRP